MNTYINYNDYPGTLNVPFVLFCLTPVHDGLPWACDVCKQAGKLCPQDAAKQSSEVFWGNSNYKRTVINPAGL